MNEKSHLYNISSEERNALRFYQGGGCRIELPSEKAYLRKFYDAEESYQVMNALLMPGSGNEAARMMNEHRKFPVVMLDEIEELIEVYCRIFSAMCKYTATQDRDCAVRGYRIDRMNTLEYLKHGQMYSFMSTTVSDQYNAEYFSRKDGILILLAESVGQQAAYIDVNDVLGSESEYSDEEEIFFAPFTRVRLQALELNEKEMAFRDINNEPPKAKYRVFMEGISVSADMLSMNEQSRQALQNMAMDADAVACARKAWMSFMEEKKPETDILEQYVKWKDSLQEYLKLRFAQIKYAE